MCSNSSKMIGNETLKTFFMRNADKSLRTSMFYVIPKEGGMGGQKTPNLDGPSPMYVKGGFKSELIGELIYSQVPIKRVGPNKRVGWIFIKYFCLSLCLLLSSCFLGAK